MCKFTHYFRCKCPSVSLVIFLSISGPTTTAYHCLEMINCSDNTWGFCIPFPFSRLRLCSSSTAGRFCRHYEKHSCVRLGLSDRDNRERLRTYEGSAIRSANWSLTLQPLVAGQAYVPHMKAIYLPFHMPYGSLVCPYRLQIDRLICRG